VTSEIAITGSGLITSQHGGGVGPCGDVGVSIARRWEYEAIELRGLVRAEPTSVSSRAKHRHSGRTRHEGGSDAKATSQWRHFRSRTGSRVYTNSWRLFLRWRYNVQSVLTRWRPLLPSVNHPVPDRVKPSFVFLTSGHSDAQGWASECPDVKNYKWRLNPVWHRMHYGCTHTATIGVKVLMWCIVL